VPLGSAFLRQIWPSPPPPKKTHLFGVSASSCSSQQGGEELKLSCEQTAADDESSRKRVIHQEGFGHHWGVGGGGLGAVDGSYTYDPHHRQFIAAACSTAKRRRSSHDQSVGQRDDPTGQEKTNGQQIQGEAHAM